MNPTTEYDALVIGAGPNGLSAAILLAQQNLKVKVIEARDSVGGGTRTEELTEPGFYHDICSAVHPTGVGAPYLKTLPLQDYGLEWIHPDYPVAHPLDHGEAVIVPKSLDEAVDRLGNDGMNYKRLIEDFVQNWDRLSNDLFGPVRIPDNPLSMMRFGWYGMFSAKLLANSIFENIETKAFFAGLAGHSIIPLEKVFTGSFGLVFAASIHAAGWPVARRGSHSITKAMAAYFESLGGEIETGNEINSTRDLPNAKSVLFDLTPKQIANIARDDLPDSYLKKLNSFTYGPGAFKMDFALSEPVPWENEDCKKAGTIHLGGTFKEIAESERNTWDGKFNDNPFVLVSQPSLFDDTRAPEGKHTLWAYCHVPNGSEQDCSSQIINQIERFAPGFRDTIISYNAMNAVDFEQYNANYIGGDINGGAQFFKQLIFRPLIQWDPYRLAGKSMYICSSSTPPGGGVHGMCGYHAAKSALKNEFGITL